MSKFFFPESFISSGDSLFFGNINQGPPPFTPNIVVPSANPVMNILNPGNVNTLRRRKYAGYWGDDVAFFTGKTPTQTVQAAVIISEGTEDNYTMMWTGYIYAPSWGDYVFETVSDDSSMFWIGDKAISGWTATNADVNNGGLHGTVPKDTMPNVIRMEVGWYPVRVVFGEATGNAYMGLRMYKYGATTDENLAMASNTATAEGFNP